MKLTAHLANLSRPQKQAAMVLTDLAILAGLVWGAFALRLGTPFPPVLLELWWLLIAVPLLSVPCLAMAGLYRAVVRYIGPQALLAVLKGVTLSALCFAALVTMGRLEGVPRTSYWIFWMLGLLGIGGSRMLARFWFQQASRRLQPRRDAIAIYGAGDAGAQLAAALENGRQYQPRFFIDDNPSLVGTEINGLRIHEPAELPRLIERREISSILLALPSLSRHRRRQIVEWLEAFPVHVMTVPTVTDIVAGRASIDDIREVGIDDILGRDPVKPSDALLDRCVCNKHVLVTGAGGSIGSELCRQILQRGPRTLLLFELSEPALYEIERELRAVIDAGQLATRLLGFLGNTQDEAKLRRIMEQFSVNTVYHAAAYKHVPMVENNLLEGVRNNVFGTHAVTRAAADCEVDGFVLVSTDKAVRPTNVMGASKRLAELILQTMATEQPAKTTFSMVRFGNVLDSSGSVVPVFREQIRQGGPVTVTHRDMTRYFMTIPEAASLVIQAGAIAEGGDVFVLDMGEPVRVLDLARRMIRLSGLQVRDEENPDGDIEIHFTGIRPGEKLFEELLIGENVQETDHPMIMRAEERRLNGARLQEILDGLEQAIQEFDCELAYTLLGEAVDGFDTRSGVHDSLWTEAQSERTRGQSAAHS